MDGSSFSVLHELLRVLLGLDIVTLVVEDLDASKRSGDGGIN